MGRLSAREVFPTLARYQAFWPRRPDVIPIGFQLKQRSPQSKVGTSDESAINYKICAKVLSTLYHDLGVLVFAGCTASQTARIGSILQKVVAWGGTADLRVLIRSPGALKHRVPDSFPLRLLGVSLKHNPHGVIVDGRISPNSIIDIGDKCTGMTEPLASAAPSTKEAVIENKVKTEMIAPLSQPGIYLETDTGRRRLPLACHVSLTGGPGTSRLESSVWISTVGRGDIVGAVQARYETGQLFERDESLTGEARRRYDAQELKTMSRHGGPRVAASAISNELWALEREIWADRAEGPQA